MTEDRNDEKPVLSRWSERKLKARAGEARQREAPDEREAPPAEDVQAELDANRAAAEAIDIETLTDQSDYTPFFRAGVPAALQSAALRKLWRSNPVFAVLDGLNDYDEDYTWPKSGSEVVKTAWKVGRGFLSDEDKPAEEQTAETAADEDRSAASGREADDRPPDEADETTWDPVPEAAAPADPADDDEAAPEPPEPPKVSLAQRLDFDAFAKVKDGG